MDPAEVYIARAQDAAKLAEGELDPAFKATLLNIAEAWLRIAEDAVEDGIARRPPEDRSFS
jgi:hypothetical protein